MAFDLIRNDITFKIVVMILNISTVILIIHNIKYKGQDI